MKKTGLFKTIMCVLFGIILLSWIFSASYFTEGELMELGMYQLGFIDFFDLFFASFEFQYFLQILILLLSVGAFYGVLNKTGKYRAWIERIVNNFKGAEFVFLLIVAFAITALTSIFDYGFNLFIFIPFLISLILAMGYDKITACLATFGAMLVGTIGSTWGAKTAALIGETIALESSTTLSIARLALLLVSLILLVVFLAKAKRTKLIKNEKEDMYLGEKISNKYSIVPIVVVFSLLFVLMVLGCTSWATTFKLEVFEDIHQAVTEFEVKLPHFNVTTEGVDAGMEKIAIFGKLLGNIRAFGNWYYAEMSIMVLVATMVIMLFYRIKLHDGLEYMAEGAKKIVKPALLVVLAYSVIYFAGNSMFFPTIASLILGITDKFNLFFTTITAAMGSFLHVDTLYLVNYVVPQIAAQEVDGIIVAILTQGIYGVTMLVAPTSAVMALGLSYLGISYKEWIKNIWKLALCLFAAVIATTIVLMIIL